MAISNNQNRSRTSKGLSSSSIPNLNNSTESAKANLNKRLSDLQVKNDVADIQNKIGQGRTDFDLDTFNSRLSQSSFAKDNSINELYQYAGEYLNQKKAQAEQQNTLKKAQQAKADMFRASLLGYAGEPVESMVSRNALANSTKKQNSPINNLTDGRSEWLTKSATEQAELRKNLADGIDNLRKYGNTKAANELQEQYDILSQYGKKTITELYSEADRAKSLLPGLKQEYGKAYDAADLKSKEEAEKALQGLPYQNNADFNNAVEARDTLSKSYSDRISDLESKIDLATSVTRTLNELNISPRDAKELDDLSDGILYRVLTNDRTVSKEDYSKLIQELDKKQNATTLSGNALNLLDDNTNTGYDKLKEYIMPRAELAKSEKITQDNIFTSPLSKETENLSLARKKEDEINKIAQFSEENPVLSSYVALGMYLPGAIKDFGDITADIIGHAVGGSSLEDIKTTKSGGKVTPDISVTETRDTIKSSVANSIDNELLRGAYNIGMSMLESAQGQALAIATGGASEWATLAAMGMSAANSTYYNSINNGASKTDAYANGVLQGLVEILTEKVSVDRLLSSHGSMKPLMERVIMQAIPEASEEAVASIIDPMIEYATLQGKSEWAKEYERLKNQGYSEKEATKSIFNSWMSDVLKDAVGGAVSGGLFGGIDAAIGKVTGRTAQAQRNEQIGQRIINNNETDEVIATARKMFADDKQTLKFVDEVEKNMTAESIGTLSSMISGNAINTVVEGYELEKNKSADAIADDMINQFFDGNKNKTLDYETSQEYASTTNPIVTIQSQTGEFEIDASALPANVAPQIINFASNLDLNGAKAYVENMPANMQTQMELENYSKRFATSYIEGHYNQAQTQQDDIGLANTAYQAGLVDGELYRASELESAGFKELKSGRYKGYTKTTDQDTSVYISNNIDLNRIDAKTKNSIDEIKLFSKLMGKNTKFVVENNNDNTNGFYRALDNSIHIDINAGDNNEGYTSNALAHELLHSVANMNSSAYASLVRSVSTYIRNAGSDMSSLIGNTISRYKAANIDLTYEEALEEVVAKSMEGILESGNVANTLAEMKADPSAIKAMKDTIHGIVERFKKLLPNYEPQTLEGQLLRKLGKKYEALEKQFAEALALTSDIANKAKITEASDAEGAKTFSLKGEKVVGDFMSEYTQMLKEYDFPEVYGFSKKTPTEVFNKKLEFYSKYQEGKATKETFFYNTMAEFSKVSRRPKGAPDYVSYSRYNGKVSSEYWYTDEGVIRGSNHWGNDIRTCDWKLKGEGLKREGVTQTSKSYGFCKWENFVYKTSAVGAERSESGNLGEWNYANAHLSTFESESEKINYSIKDVSKYSQKQYNSFGWVGNLLSEEDTALLKDKYVVLPRKTEKDRLYVEHINNKTVVLSGNYSNPIIETVIYYNANNEAELETYQDIYESELGSINYKGQDWNGYIQYVSSNGEETIFTCYMREDYTDYTGLKDSRRPATKPDAYEDIRYYRDSENGAGVSSINGENRNDGEIKLSLKDKDSEYLELAKNPKKNAAKLRTLVNEAAERNGYSRPMFHGSRKSADIKVFKDWQYFTENKAYAERYADAKLYEVFVKLGQVFDTREESARELFYEARNEYGMSNLNDNGLPDWTDGYDICDYIDENDLKYDSVVLDEGGDMVDGKPVSRGESYVVRKSAQVKSADLVTYDDKGKIIPLSERFNEKNEDIRYSLKKNSDGDPLTQAQAEYFKDSQVRDKEGNVLLMHHGTNEDFSVFEKNKIGKNGAFEGTGFNFTPSRGRASSYGGKVLSGYLNIIKPLSASRITMSVSELADIIKKVDPTGDDIIANYARETRDYGKQSFVDREALTTARAVLNFSENDVDIYSDLSAGAGGSVELMQLFNDIGYDGVIHYDDDGNIKTAIAFNSNQFKLADNLNPTENENINFSLKGINKDGIEVYETSSKTKKMSNKQKTRTYTDLIKKTYIGRTARFVRNGHVYYAKFDSGIVGKTIFGEHKTSKAGVKAIRNAGADGDIFDIVENAKYNGRAVDGKNHKSSDGFTDYFVYFHKYVQIDNIVFSVDIDVKKQYGNRSGFTYTVKLVEDKTKQPSPAMVNISTTQVPAIAATNNIPQSNAVSQTGKSSHSLKNANSKLSERTLLAKAMEDSAVNDEELRLAKQYFEYADYLDRRRADAEELKTERKELMFTKGKRDTAKIDELTREINKAETEIAKYDRKLLKLKALKPMADLLSRETNKAYKKAQAEGRQALAEYREKTTAKMLDMKLKRREYFASKRRTAIRNKIIGIAKDLQDRFLKSTDARFVPGNLVDGIIEVCNMIDPTGPNQESQAAVKYRTGRELLLKLKSEYDSIKRMDNDFASEFDEEFSSHIDELANVVGNTPVRNMTDEQLQDTADILSDISFMVQTATKQIGTNEKISNYEAGEEIIKQMKELESNGYASKNKVTAFFREWTLNPIRAVKEMSAFDKNGRLVKLFDEIINGQRQANKFTMDATKKFDELRSTKEGEKAFNKAVEDYYDFGLTDIDGKPLKITKMQAMQLVLTYNREATNKNRKHLETGALIPDAKLLAKGKYTQALDNGQRIGAVTPNVISTIMSHMTEWDKKYMEITKSFFNEDAKKAINETMWTLKHRLVATEDNYIPYEINKQFVSTQNENVVYNSTIENTGSLKSVMPNARQEVVMNGLNAIVDRHIKDTAKIYGLAIPVRNVNKVLNMKEVIDTGSDSVKHAISKTWGSKSLDLIMQAVADVQSARRGDTIKILNFVKSGFVTSTLASNLSVWMKQAASYPTAGSILSTEALTKGLAKYVTTKSGKIWNEIDEHTAQHWLRRQGLSLQELGEMNQSKGWVNKINSKFGKASPMNWIQAMDVATTAALWEATKAEIDSIYKDIAKGSDEYWKKVTELYDRVIEETQPMYDPLHRAEITKNKLASTFIVFQTQPIQNSGIIRDGIMGYKAAKKLYGNNSEELKVASKNLRKAVTSQMAAQLTFTIFTLVAALLTHRVDPYRDKDKNLSFESVAKEFGIEYAQNMFNSFVPVIGGYANTIADNLMNGTTYDIISDPTLEKINSSYKTFSYLIKDIDENGITSWDDKRWMKLRNISADIASYLGIPANNALKIFDGARLHIEDIFNEEPLSFEAGVERSQKQMGSIAYNALQKGDTATANKIKSEFGDDNKYNSKVKDSIKAQYQSGEITKSKAIGDLIRYSDKTQEQATKLVDNW